MGATISTATSFSSSSYSASTFSSAFSPCSSTYTSASATTATATATSTASSNTRPISPATLRRRCHKTPDISFSFSSWPPSVPAELRGWQANSWTVCPAASPSRSRSCASVPLCAFTSTECWSNTTFAPILTSQCNSRWRRTASPTAAFHSPSCDELARSYCGTETLCPASRSARTDSSDARSATCCLINHSLNCRFCKASRATGSVDTTSCPTSGSSDSSSTSTSASTESATGSFEILQLSILEPPGSRGTTS